MKSTKMATGNNISKGLWRVHTLVFLGLVALFYSLWIFFSLQGKFTAYMETIPPDPLSGIVDYRFIIKTLDGFKTRSYDFGRFYGGEYHKDNNDRAFSPNHEPTVNVVSKDVETGQTILAIWGKNFRSSTVLSLVSYVNGEFRSIPFYNGSRHREIYFVAQKILLKNLDDDPEREVILGIFLTSEDGSAHTWDKTRLDYNSEKQAYLQTSTTHEPNLE